MKTALIAAIGPKNELGFQGDLPWGRDLPEDLAYFKKITLGSAVIMGRKTWESFKGKGLVDRTNIIVTRKPKGAIYQQLSKFNAHAKVLVPQCKSVALALMQAQVLRQEKVFFIGGADIYREALPLVDEIYLNLVEKMTGPLEADVFFPEFNIEDYEQVSEETYFTEEYTVTNLVLGKKELHGKRRSGSGSSMVRDGASRAVEAGKTSKVHWQGASSVPAGNRSGYGY
jgi:dihydrofolate reductase